MMTLIENTLRAAMRGSLAACIALLLLFAPAARVGAQAPVAVSLTPLRFEFAGYAGQELSGTLFVVNGTDAALPVTLEVEDFLPQGEEGRVVVGPQDDTSHSLTSWVRFSFEEFTVFSKQRFPLDFTVDIPPDAEPGTHYGAILARARTDPAEAEGTEVAVRVGALVLVDVYGEVKESLSVVGINAPTFAFSPPVTLILRLANNGTVRAKPIGTITVTNLFGSAVATIPLPERNVLPQAIRRIEVSVSEGLLAGKYRVKLEGAYGRKNDIPLIAEKTFWFVDWRNVGLPALIFMGLAVFLIAKRRKIAAEFRSSGAREEHLPEAPAPDDSNAPVPEKRGGGRTPRKLDL